MESLKSELTFHGPRDLVAEQASSDTESDSVSATVEAGLSNTFSAAITTEYGHSWSCSTSETEEIGAEVPQYGLLARGQPERQAAELTQSFGREIPR
ncbi:hypothetical protein OK074_2633 [Actinobacteria bacterium OK074]|nr:hypothetical protein OK074_2633 [Actinobacteria bacterium OK074]